MKDGVCTDGVNLLLLDFGLVGGKELDVERFLTARMAEMALMAKSLEQWGPMESSSYPATLFVMFASSSVKKVTSKSSLLASRVREVMAAAFRLVGRAPLGSGPPAFFSMAIS